MNQKSLGQYQIITHIHWVYFNGDVIKPRLVLRHASLITCHFFYVDENA